MADPKMDMLRQLMGASQQAAPMPAPAEASDEEMLDTVRESMGERSRSTPPPQGGMQWIDVEADRAALLQNPTPENIAAFTDYWSPDELPEELRTEEAIGGYLRNIDEGMRPR